MPCAENTILPEDETVPCAEYTILPEDKTVQCAVEASLLIIIIFDFK